VSDVAGIASNKRIRWLITMPFTALEHYGHFLQKQGRRMTCPRRLVAKTVIGLSAPFVAESVVELLGRKVGRATVYRTLHELTDAGLIRTRGDLFVPGLCAETHRTMIAGTCPWCGFNVFQG